LTSFFDYGNKKIVDKQAAGMVALKYQHRSNQRPPAKQSWRMQMAPWKGPGPPCGWPLVFI
jgi:hypothetical protein